MTTGRINQVGTSPQGWGGRGRTGRNEPSRPPLTYLVFRVFPFSRCQTGTGACRLTLGREWGSRGAPTSHDHFFLLAQPRPGALGHLIRAAGRPPCGAPARRTAQTVLTSLHPSDRFLETTFIDGPLREEPACYRERHERAAASSLEERKGYTRLPRRRLHPIDAPVLNRGGRLRGDSRRQRRRRKGLLCQPNPFLFFIFHRTPLPTCRNLTRTTLEKREFRTRSPRRRSAYPAGSVFSGRPHVGPAPSAGAGRHGGWTLSFFREKETTHGSVG